MLLLVPIVPSLRWKALNAAAIALEPHVEWSSRSPRRPTCSPPSPTMATSRSSSRRRRATRPVSCNSRAPTYPRCCRSSSSSTRLCAKWPIRRSTRTKSFAPSSSPKRPERILISCTVFNAILFLV